MGVKEKLLGTLEDTFQIGKRGPKFKKNGDLFEARDKDDSAYVIVRGDHPIDPNDLVTKQFFDSGIGANTLFGDEFQTEEETDFQSTTGISFLEALKLTTPVIPAGTYYIEWGYVWSRDSTQNDFVARVQVDDTTDLINPAAADGNQGLHQQEPKDSLGSGNGGTNQRLIVGGHATVALTNAAHTIDIDFRTASVGVTASVHHCRVSIWRIN